MISDAGQINIDTNKWRDFVFNHPQGNVFHLPEMFEVYRNTKYHKPVLTSIQENGELTGILLGVIQKENSGLFGKLTARSIIWGGPLVKERRPDLLNQIVGRYNDGIKNKAIYSQFRNLWFWNEEKKEILSKNGYHFVNHLDIIHDLTKPIGEQRKLLHKGRRKNIRRAERSGLQFTEVIDPSEFKICLSLIKKTYKKVKLPLPSQSFFFNSFQILGKKDLLKIFAAKLDRQIIGARLVLCHKNLIYDWYAGADDHHLDKYPNDFLPWKVMEWGTNNGYHYFDFGGAGKPGIPYGVRDHKLKFGGELVEFGRFECIHKPLLFQTGNIGLKVYKKLK